MNIYFTDFFDIEESLLETYGAFNVSLINDLPLFIDPFLLFGSKKPEYQELHSSIIQYLTFLKNKAELGPMQDYQIQSWYIFPEVKQNWFGYSKVGNSGRGLNMTFGRAFSSSIKSVFDDLGKEIVTQSSHLEKAGLFQIGIGRDNISDFTTNLIKNFLCEYTQSFAENFLASGACEDINVEKAYFDYNLERWMPKIYRLPVCMGDYVLLTPKDLLTKDNNWINANDLRGNFTGILNSIPNTQLKHEVFNYYRKCLPAKEDDAKNSAREIAEAIQETLIKYPEIVKLYVKSKEENKEGARNVSEQNVKEVETIFIQKLKEFVSILEGKTSFYNIPKDGSFEESMSRVKFLKQVIETNDGYRIFYLDGVPIKREEDIQLIYRLTWYATDYDVNRETNNGRGPADYVVSKGAFDKTVIEFKLASNSKLKQNLNKQVGVYEEANGTTNSIKIILYFSASEFNKTRKILEELKLDKATNIVLINAEKKISASNVK